MLYHLRKLVNACAVFGVLAGVGVVPALAQESTRAVCWTDETMAAYWADHPEEKRAYDQLQEQLNLLLEEELAALANSRQKTADEEVTYRFRVDTTRYTIPVVVHFVYGGAKPNENLAVSQMKILFDDYRRRPGSASFGGRGVDTQIEFSLATIDPDGNPTTGVTFTQNATWANLPSTSGPNVTAMKQATRWDQKRYYNCWVVSSIGGGVLGFASYPNSDNNNDGSVVDIGTFGNTGNFFGGARRYGRTTTHEFGHGMNLAHPFQGGCGNSCTSSGDLVCDTPPTADQNFGKGFQRQNTCTNDRPDLPDNPRNYMDYLDDEGMTYFSLGQKTRMHNALRLSNNTQRFPLWQRRNLERTGTGPFKAPECDFVADNIQTCAGAAVTFFDFSIGSPHQFEWEFPGGVPATSTERNPEVVYPEAGFYSVTLTVTNRSGESSTKTKIGYITVSDQKVKIPYSFNFDDGSFEAEGFQVQNPDSTYINPNGNNPLSRTWGPSNFGAESSGGSARIEFFNYSEYGQKDGLVTPAIDLTGEDSVAVVFSHAYSPYVELDNNNDPQTPYYDSLAVWASGDCGQNWVRLYYKGGEELATRSIEEAAQFRAFVPNDDQWVTDTLNLARFAGSPNVRIRFEAINGFGNSLYIDEIKLERIGFTGRKPNSAAIVQKVTLAPNPSDNTTQVHLSLARTESVSLRVLDPLGRQVFSNGAQLLGAGEHSLPLQVPGLTAGIYMVQVQAGGHFQTKRWVVR